MPFDQIHFGAGRRGVGAILPLSLDAGGRVHVVVHKASELSPGSQLVCSVYGPNQRRNDLALEVASLSRANAIEQLEPSARAVLLSAPELLLTTALSPLGVEAQREFLIALARARADAGRRTIFIPCEEEIGEEHSDLLERLRALDVDVRRSVLDRLCSQEPLTTGEYRRAVRADEHVEWLIEGSAEGPLLESLAQVSGVAFSEHIDQYALRARWLARGIRLSLALLAAEAKQPQIRVQTVESERERWLERVYAALVPLVEARCPDLDCTSSYVARQVEALLRHDDDGLTVLRNMRRASLRPFMRELQRSIGEPWRDLVRSGAAPPAEMHRVLFAIQTVLGDIENYSDYKPYAWGDMLLHADADARAIAAYEELLTGILSSQQVQERASTLEYCFDEHREELPG